MNPTVQNRSDRAMVAAVIQTLCLAQLPLIALWYLLKGRDDGSEIGVFRAACWWIVSLAILANLFLCITLLL